MIKELKEKYSQQNKELKEVYSQQKGEFKKYVKTKRRIGTKSKLNESLLRFKKRIDKALK